MKCWIIGLLLLGIVIPLINGQKFNDDDDDDEDYGVQRFPIEIRRLDDRHKMPNEEDADDEDDSMDQDGNMDTDTENGNQEPTGLLIRDTDLAGNAGILVIQNGAPPNSPVLFELRPVDIHSKDKYFEVQDENDPDAPDNEDNADMQNNNNGYMPNTDLDTDEENQEDEPPIRRRVKPTKKPKRRRPSSQLEEDDNLDEDTMEPSKKKPKRPTSPASKKKRKSNRRKNQNRNQNKKKNKKKKKKNTRKGPGYNGSQGKRKNLKKKIKHDVVKNKKNRVNINQGFGTNTVTNTVTTTQSGGADDVPGVNRIIINKPSPPATQRPFWNFLGRSAGDRQADRSFGRKKHSHQRLWP